MKKVVGFVFACLGIILGFAAATPAHAQILHSFVSGNGGGTACTFSAPCAALNNAVAATSSGGLVTCVDQGANSFGNSEFGVSITKSITIDCAGISAGVFNVTINGPGIVVTLRNLIITGANIGSLGVDFQNGSALFVEHCVIENWTEGGNAIGIHFAPPSGVRAFLYVTDSVIKNNGSGSGGGGVIILPSGSGAARAVIERTTVENNVYGIAVATGTNVVINRSVFSGNTVAGVEGDAGAQVAVNNSTVSHNNIGVQSGSSVRLSNNDIAFNNTAISGVSGTFGNNRFSGNVTLGTAPTPLGGASSDLGQQ
jgi:Right handed beta helix region